MMKKTTGLLSYELSENHPQHSSLWIAGAFSQGMYLQNPDGGLIMLHDTAYGSIPFGIAIEGVGQVLRDAGVDEHCEAHISDVDLVITGRQGSLTIDFALRGERPAMPASPVDAETFCGTIIDRLQYTDKGVLKHLADPEEPWTAYSKMAVNVIGGRSTFEALPDLIGLGPGLTPSGDDFICGMLYYMKHRIGLTDEQLPVIETISRRMKKLTNTVSCVYLDSVIKGERFTMFDEVCFADSADSLRRAATNLLTMGSNSGADVLCGMVCAAVGC